MLLQCTVGTKWLPAAKSIRKEVTKHVHGNQGHKAMDTTAMMTNQATLLKMQECHRQVFQSGASKTEASDRRSVLGHYWKLKPQ